MGIIQCGGRHHRLFPVLARHLALGYVYLYTDLWQNPESPPQNLATAVTTNQKFLLWRRRSEASESILGGGNALNIPGTLIVEALAPSACESSDLLPWAISQKQASLTGPRIMNSRSSTTLTISSWGI